MTTPEQQRLIEQADAEFEASLRQKLNNENVPYDVLKSLVREHISRLKDITSIPDGSEPTDRSGNEGSN